MSFLQKIYLWILWYYAWRILVISCPFTFIKIQFHLIIILVNHPPGPYVLGYSPKVVSTSVAVLIYAYCKILFYHISFGQVSAFTILVWYQHFLGLSYHLVPFLSCWLQVLLHVVQHSNELKWYQNSQNDSWSSFFFIFHVFLVSHFHSLSSWFFSSHYLVYFLLFILSLLPCLILLLLELWILTILLWTLAWE